MPQYDSKTISKMKVATLVLISIFQVFCQHSVNFKKRHKKSYHKMIINNYYRQRSTWTTSTLGSVLYKNMDENVIERRSKTFLVLLWKYWNDLKHRFAIDPKTERYDPLKSCSVKNCKFTGDSLMFHIADAVIVFLVKGDLPRPKKRNINQRWIFLSDESPINTFAAAKVRPTFSQLHNVFNWSMTYRSDSDVSIPYGRTIPLPKPAFPPKTTTFDDIASLVPFWEQKRRDVLITVLMSHCVCHRMQYIKNLRKLIKVDFFGRCSYTFKLRKKCPGHVNTDCGIISDYLFYLVLENSACRQYMTEKLFYNAYLKGAIPIIRHPSVHDCEKLLPPNSFLHIDNYGSMSQLVNAIKTIVADEKELLSYHIWRNHFNITNEHGFFGSESLHLCRVCQALNYNSRDRKRYEEDDMRLFLDPKILCSTIWDKVFVYKQNRNISTVGRRTHSEIYKRFLSGH